MDRVGKCESLTQVWVDGLASFIWLGGGRSDPGLHWRSIRPGVCRTPGFTGPSLARGACLTARGADEKKLIREYKIVIFLFDLLKYLISCM